MQEISDELLIIATDNQLDDLVDFVPAGLTLVACRLTQCSTSEISVSH